MPEFRTMVMLRTERQQPKAGCRCIERGSMPRGLMLALLAVVVAAFPARGQTLFAWPRDTVDVARYATVEDCLAAIQRMKDSLSVEKVWRDTLPHTPERAAADARASLSAQTMAVARRCSERFATATAPLADFAPLLALDLAAGRDAEASSLVERRLKAIGSTAEDERAAVLDTVIAAYLGGRFQVGSFPPWLGLPPARLAAADSFLTLLGRIKMASWQMRLRNYYAFMNAAWDTADTARALRASQAAVAIASMLTDAQRRTNDFQSFGEGLHSAVAIAQKPALLDSLRRSTASYVALYRTLIGRVLAGVTITRKPVGEPAPPILVDYGFRRGDSTASRPVKGKVNVVVFLEPCYDTYGNPECQAVYAVLRRLAQRFPDLEFTLVTGTRGYFSKAAPPRPSEEAAMLAHAWLEERHLPGALVVTTTPFWRLPDPDRRRIDQDVPNGWRYAFGRSWITPFVIQKHQGRVAPFLIDEEGTVVDAAFQIRDVEREWPELIEILLSRHLASRP